MDYRKDVNDMLEIKGRVTTAICYAKVIEDEAIEQIRRMCDYDLTRGSKSYYSGEYTKQCGGRF